MSAGYASRLSEYPNKGEVGLPESFDTPRAVTVKVRRLVTMMKEASHLVILTGAGISTSAKIPDFRGPKGIWTLEKEQRRPPPSGKTKMEGGRNGKRKRPIAAATAPAVQQQPPPPSSSTPSLPLPSPHEEEEEEDAAVVDFAKALPTLTHRAIAKLTSTGMVKYCITQNVDGLHRRSGLSRDFHSTVHGCVFTEKCKACGCEYFGDADTGGLSFRPTGNTCDECGDDLYDIVLDWEDPVIDVDRARKECEQADLVLCLGTSLRIEPVGSFPLLAKQFVIVNLQPTPKDDDAVMIIRARVDQVMDQLMTQLGHTHWKDEPAPTIERKWKPTKSQDFVF